MALLNEADAVYLGTAAADRVYLGSTMVWEPSASGLQPPTDVSATTSGTLAAPTGLDGYAVGGGV